MTCGNKGGRSPSSNKITPEQWHTHFKNVLNNEKHMDENFSQFVELTMNTHDQECDICDNDFN